MPNVLKLPIHRHLSHLSQDQIDNLVNKYTKTKKRVSKIGQGKSGSSRTIIAFKINDKSFFMYGFSKNEKDNINNKQLEAFKILSNNVLSYTDEKIRKLLLMKELAEVLHE